MAVVVVVDNEQQHNQSELLIEISILIKEIFYI